MKRTYFSFDRNLNLKKGDAPSGKTNSKPGKFLLAKYTDIGYYLVTPLLIGVFLGLFFSRITGKEFFVLVGIIGGAISTFYNLFRLIK